jgi:hypothetical protein
VAGVCFAAAVAGWWPRLAAWFPFSDSTRGGQVAAGLSREYLLAAGGDRVGRWPWSTDAGSSARVTGDVVWNDTLQTGYLRFEGLEPNDPARHQYQLWIVDASRDDRYPVDGGVFDAPKASGQLVVPIRAAVPVREPAAFVVTLEKSGGAVVSSREHVVAIARTAGR